MENNQTIVSNGNGDTWGEKRSEGRNGGKEGMAEWAPDEERRREGME